MSQPEPSIENNKHIPWKLVVIFAFFTVGIFLIALSYYKSQRNRIYAENENNLTAISNLKIGQIEQWHSERLGDAVTIKENDLITGSIRKYMTGEDSLGIKKNIIKWMDAVLKEYDYSSVSIIDTLLMPKIVVPAGDSFEIDVIRDELNSVLKTHEIFITDLYRSKCKDAVNMDIIIPLIAPGSKNQKLFGFMILRIDPGKVLFPLIQSWPISSKSAETLLLRKDGDSILYLNELRHLKNSALKLKLPATNKNLLASKALTGIEGVTEGVDYRNVGVIGSINKFHFLPWYMIAKVDKAEIRAPLKRYFYLASVATMLLILINASVFIFWVWEQRVSLRRNQLLNELQLKQAEIDKRKSEERFILALDSMIEGCQIIGFDWKFLYINDTAVIHNRRPKEELLGKTYMEMWPGIENTEVFHRIRRCLEQRINDHIENEFVFPDGQTGWFDVRIQPVQEGVFILSIDITEHKLAELKKQESERLFRNLFDNMLNGFAYCKMIFKDHGPLDFIYLNVNKAFESLTGLKDVSGKKVSDVIPGIQNEDHELLERYGRVALTGNPEVFEIFVESMKMWFSISVYSPEKEYFVAVFDVITERKLAEESLRDSEQKFRNTIHNLDEGFYSVDVNGILLDHNQAFNRILGFDLMMDMKETNLPDFWQYPEERDRYLEELADKGAISDFLIHAKNRTGDKITVLASAHSVKDKDNNIVRIEGIFQDITERNRILETLEEERNLLRTIMDLLPSFVFVKDKDSRFLMANKACAKFMGANDSVELIGKTDEEFYNVEAASVFRSDELLVLDGIPIIDKEEGSSSPSGVTRSLLTTKVPLRDKNGNIIGLVGASFDISEIRHMSMKIEEERNKLSSLLNSIPDEVWFADTQKKFTLANPNAVKTFGLANQENIDVEHFAQNLKVLRPDGSIRPVEEAPPLRALNGEVIKNLEEIVLIPSSNELRNRQVNAAPVRDASGKIIGAVSVVRDITELKKLNSELEQRVNLRTGQLEAANKELEAFSYSVSHDLRAPLRSVHGFTKILLEDYDSILDEEGKRICGIISSSAMQMGRLIDDLLNFSRIGRSSLSPSLLDMKSMAESVFAEISTDKEKIRTNLEIGDLHKAYGDANLLRLVWNNLISNAIKYSSKKKRTKIIIGSALEGDMITYYIRDNGVGFDMQYKHKLFGVFQRLHSESEFEGNGVGLAIVQRIILKSGGRVWAEGVTGKGATFYFSLPVQKTVDEDTRLATHDSEQTTNGSG